jgi:hypothetical protein
MSVLLFLCTLLLPISLSHSIKGPVCFSCINLSKLFTWAYDQADMLRNEFVLIVTLRTKAFIHVKAVSIIHVSKTFPVGFQCFNLLNSSPSCLPRRSAPALAICAWLSEFNIRKPNQRLWLEYSLKGEMYPFLNCTSAHDWSQLCLKRYLMTFAICVIFRLLPSQCTSIDQYVTRLYLLPARNQLTFRLPFERNDAISSKASTLWLHDRLFHPCVPFVPMRISKVC